MVISGKLNLNDADIDEEIDEAEEVDAEEEDEEDSDSEANDSLVAELQENAKIRKEKLPDSSLTWKNVKLKKMKTKMKIIIVLLKKMKKMKIPMTALMMKKSVKLKIPLLKSCRRRIG